MDGQTAVGRDVRVEVRLHGALRDPAGGRDRLAVNLPPGATVALLLDALGDLVPAVERRIRDETGAVRRHVNLFVDGEHLRPARAPAHPLVDGAEVLVLPAVSGGATAGLGRARRPAALR